MGLKKSMSSEFTTEEEASEKEATVPKGFICKLKKKLNDKYFILDTSVTM